MNRCVGSTLLPAALFAHIELYSVAGLPSSRHKITLLLEQHVTHYG